MCLCVFVSSPRLPGPRKEGLPQTSEGCLAMEIVDGSSQRPLGRLSWAGASAGGRAAKRKRHPHHPDRSFQLRPHYPLGNQASEAPPSEVQAPSKTHSLPSEFTEGADPRAVTCDTDFLSSCARGDLMPASQEIAVGPCQEASDTKPRASNPFV